MRPDELSLDDSYRARLLNLPRHTKQTIMVASDIVGWVLCATAASLLVDGVLPRQLQTAMMLVIVVAVCTPLASWFGLYRSIIRFIGADVYVAAMKTGILGTLIVGPATAYANLLQSPLRWSIVFGASLVIFLIGSRYLARSFLNRRSAQPERVIIYGAGAAGVRLASALNNGMQFLPVAFVDDSPALQGRVVHGANVYPPADIEKLSRELDAKQLLLAMPSVSRRRRREVLEQLMELPVHVQTVPEICDLVSGQARVDDIREVAVADLLGRNTVPPNPKLLHACVEDKVVMVTGAGGSIGSELCRQILALNPRSLVLFEISEVALYAIERQLIEQAGHQQRPPDIVALLGSVHSRNRVREIMQAYSVQTVYHAAAYKHVPLVEHNIVEGALNNVFGTLNAAKAATETGVETFVLISTDKAVKPTNVMGATKRFAELVLQALHVRNSSIRFCMVRFGNVLASSGSVVPLFREQIHKGGPVTVTHPEIIRYFMTIPEAAQLVIQAGSMATGGDVFVLDMGKPVKILDLARRMIHLMGLTVQDEDNPDGDIEIKFTGLRPAEKLYEELLLGTDVAGTEHPRILRAREDFIAPESLDRLIDELWEASVHLDSSRIRDVLMRAVSGYQPTNDIEDLVWTLRNRQNAAAPSRKVTELSSYRDQP